MTTPYQRQPRPTPPPSDVEALAVRLESAVHVLHCGGYADAYGPLVGPQANTPRSLPARLRLGVEKHLCDALRLIEGDDVEAFLEYPEDDSRIDDPDARPIGLTIQRQRCEPIMVPLAWPGRGMKSLRFEPTPPLSHRTIAVMLGAPDAGEALVSTVCQLVAAAVVMLDDGDALEAA